MNDWMPFWKKRLSAFDVIRYTVFVEGFLCIKYDMAFKNGMEISIKKNTFQSNVHFNENVFKIKIKWFAYRK